MTYTHIRKLSIILLTFYLTSPFVVKAKNNKTHAGKKKPKTGGGHIQKQVLPQGQLPSGMQLIKRTLTACNKKMVLDILMRAGFSGKAISAPMSDEDIAKMISVLEGKDLIAIFDVYLNGFTSNPEPFEWDVVRMATFIQIAEQRLKDEPLLLADYEKNKAYYKSEFSIDAFSVFKKTLRALITESRHLHNELKDTNKLSATGVLSTLREYLERLQKQMPRKLADTIKTQLESNTGLSTQLQLVGQVRQRLNRK